MFHRVHCFCFQFQFLRDLAESHASKPVDEFEVGQPPEPWTKRIPFEGGRRSQGGATAVKLGGSTSAADG